MEMQQMQETQAAPEAAARETQEETFHAQGKKEQKAAGDWPCGGDFGGGCGQQAAGRRRAACGGQHLSKPDRPAPGI